ncbi:MAG: hypothetical protein WC822_01405 [Candidatus Paceibacterota bacterium]|jgi:hypothetical protein
MSMREFIRQHRKELDEYIRKPGSNIGSLNDKEREMWVLNDEGLYNWARQEGVKV